MPSSRTPPPALVTAAWLAALWLVVFWRLGLVSVTPDGAHYAQLTREMLRNGSWLVPLLDGVPYIDKPVAFHWLQGTALALMGESDLALRLPSALAAVALMLLTRWVGARLFGRSLAATGALMLLTVPATFVLSRTGYMDMLFATFLFGGLACFLVTLAGGPRHLRLAGYALIVCAVMTKGPVALVLLVTFGGLVWLGGGDWRRALETLRWKQGLVMVLLASSPWFVWMHWRFGDEFLQSYFVTGHLSYLMPRASASSSTNLFYGQMFVTAFFPWSVVVLGYAVDTARHWRAEHRAPPTIEALLWLWILSVIVLFTAARFRVDRYIYPAAPACCLLAARAWTAARSAIGSEFRATRVAIFGVAVVFMGAGAVLWARLSHLGLEVPRGGYALPALLCLGGLAMALSMLRDGFRPLSAQRFAIPTLLGVYGLVVAFGLPLVEQAKPAREVGNWLRDLQVDEPIAVLGLEGWHNALRYYAGRRVEQLATLDDARTFFSEPGPGWVVMRRRSYEALVRSGVSADVAFSMPIVVGTEGAWIRRQVWGRIFVVRKAG